MRGAALRRACGQWLLAGTAVASGLALGSIHTAVLVAVALGATLATVLISWDAEPFELRGAARALLAVATGLVVWTAFQCVPMPATLLSSISSANADIWSRALRSLGEPGPAWTPISLDPIASRIQVLRGIAYLAFFVGALQIARKRDGVAFLERTLLVGAAGVAVAAFLHPVLGAHKVFGIYEPKEKLAYDAAHLAPLLNVNHLAGYVNVGLFVALASALRAREAIPRPIAIVTTLLLGATTVSTSSRGGTGAMVLGAVLVVFVTFYAGRSRGPRAAGAAAIALVACVGAGLFLIAAFDSTRAKFMRNDLAKVDLVSNALALVRDHGVVGVGRGAFESVFPKVRTGTDYWVFTHPENVFAQWTTEWGVPVALIAFVVIAWALRPQTALARSRPPVGPWAALVALTFHNLVDFSSEIPGIVIPLVVCAAMVVGGAGAAQGRQRDRWTGKVRLLAVAIGASSVAVSLLVITTVDDELTTERRRFAAQPLDQGESREAFHSRVRGAMLRHPSEPYFPYIGALRAILRHDESLLPWADRVLELSPVHGRVHLLLARWLFARSPSQARLEYRLACTQDSNLCGLQEAMPLVLDYDDAVELVPEGARGARVLAQLALGLNQRLPSTVVRLDEELIVREPLNVDPVLRAADNVLRDVRNQEGWCGEAARMTCIEHGLEKASMFRARSPERCDGHLLVAELKIAGGQLDAAMSELDSQVEHVEDRSTCFRRVLLLTERVGDRSRLPAALERLLNAPCSEEECIENLLVAASVESRRGASGRALTLKRRALERAPERDDLVIAVADDARSQGLHAEAFDAYRKLAERHPEDRRWTEAMDRERAALRRSPSAP